MAIDDLGNVDFTDGSFDYIAGLYCKKIVSHPKEVIISTIALAAFAFFAEKYKIREKISNQFDVVGEKIYNKIISIPDGFNNAVNAVISSPDQR